MNDLIAVTAGWGVIALGVAGLYLFGRDPKADEHDLSDYHETAGGCETVPGPPTEAVGEVTHYLRPVTAFESMISQLVRATPVAADDILPPAPEGMNAGSPLYAGMLFDTWHPEDADAVAARWLRDIAAVEQAKAGIRPAYATADRDMTGAFPVVRAAA